MLAVALLKRLMA